MADSDDDPYDVNPGVVWWIAAAAILLLAIPFQLGRSLWRALRR